MKIFIFILIAVSYISCNSIDENRKETKSLLTEEKGEVISETEKNREQVFLSFYPNMDKNEFIEIGRKEIELNNIMLKNVGQYYYKIFIKKHEADCFEIISNYDNVELRRFNNPEGFDPFGGLSGTPAGNSKENLLETKKLIKRYQKNMLNSLKKNRIEYLNKFKGKYTLLEFKSNNNSEEVFYFKNKKRGVKIVYEINSDIDNSFSIYYYSLSDFSKIESHLLNEDKKIYEGQKFKEQQRKQRIKDVNQQKQNNNTQL